MPKNEKEDEKRRSSSFFTSEERKKFDVNFLSFFFSLLSFLSFPKKMSGGRPTDHLEPAAKKRGSDRQLTKDDVEGSDDESGGEVKEF